MSRPFTVVDVVQGTPEWLLARCAKLTGTCAADMLAKIKSGEAAARRNLRTRLVVERLTNLPQEDGFVSADMRRGSELEPEAIAAYEAVTGNLVQRFGFLAHAELPVGFSPDGIVDDFRGFVEVKVPRSATHMAYLRGRTLPADYRDQVLHGFYVTGAEFCDFCSYDPRFPSHLQLFHVRVERNDFDVMTYGRAVETFLAEVEAEYQEALKIGVAAQVA